MKQAWQWKVICVATGEMLGRYKTTKRAKLWAKAYRDAGLVVRLEKY